MCPAIFHMNEWPLNHFLRRTKPIALSGISSVSSELSQGTPKVSLCARTATTFGLAGHGGLLWHKRRNFAVDTEREKNTKRCDPLPKMRMEIYIQVFPQISIHNMYA